MLVFLGGSCAVQCTDVSEKVWAWHEGRSGSAVEVEDKTAEEDEGGSQGRVGRQDCWTARTSCGKQHDGVFEQVQRCASGVGSLG